MSNQFDPSFALSHPLPQRDFLTALTLVVAIVLLNLFVDTLQRNVQRGHALRQAQAMPMAVGLSVAKRTPKRTLVAVGAAEAAADSIR